MRRVPRAFGILHLADAGSVLPETFDGHANPTVVHPQGFEDFLPHVGRKGAAVEPPDQFAQDVPACVRMVTGALARYPTSLELGGADAGNDLVPIGLRPSGVDPAKAAGVG